MAYVFDPNNIPSLAVVGTDELFPARHIYYVGRN